MKKAAAIFVFIIYALSATGVAVKADYCCNNLKSISLVLAYTAKDKEGCCKVKYETFKVKDAHAAADVVSTPAVHFTFVHTLTSCLQFSDIISKTTYHVGNIHAPPLISSSPVYLTNCVFRI